MDVDVSIYLATKTRWAHLKKSVSLPAVPRVGEFQMRKHYDFSQAVRNPYAKRLKKQLTIRLDCETVDYFQGLAQEMSLPYQTLMNMYLRECAAERRRPHWAPPPPAKRVRKALQRPAAGGGHR